MNGPSRVLAVMAVGAMAVASATVPCKADEPLPRTVLILEESNANFPSYVDFSSAFSAALNAGSRSRVDVYTESLDISRFGGAEYEQILLRYSATSTAPSPSG